MRVYDIAKEMDISSKDLADIMKSMGIPVKNHMSALTPQQEKYFRNNFTFEKYKSGNLSVEAKKADTLNKKDSSVKSNNQPKKPVVKEEVKKASDNNNQGASRPRNNYNQQNNQNNQNSQSNQNQQRNRDFSNNRNNNQDNRDRRPNNNQNSYNQNRDNSNQNRDSSNQNRENRPYNNNRPNFDNRNQNNNRPNFDNRGQNNNRPNYDRNNSNNQGQNRGYSQDRNNNPRFNNNNNNNNNNFNKDRQGQNRFDPNNRGSYKKREDGKSESTGENILVKPSTQTNKKTRQEKDRKNKDFQDKRFGDNDRLKVVDNSKKTKGTKSSYKAEKKRNTSLEDVKITELVIPSNITVGDLANKLEQPLTELIKILMGYGIMASVNQVIDFETASIVCEELGVTTIEETEDDIIERILQKHYENKEMVTKRPPIITVMGHVDHGKTSLLDAIRHTNVIGGEAGGITQHIGAYTIETKGEKITFIDTPGHAAFTAMRSRGASVTDIAVLVVAADDGVMPQTIEAINHAKAAEVPIIVAVNKIDKPGANPDRVKQELSEQGLIVEDWGGDVIAVNVSAKNKEGISDLLDMILLVSEVGELTANPKEAAVGTVIEARLDKQRGSTSTLLIKSGTLREGDLVVAGAVFGRIRAMMDDTGKKLKEAGPSTAVEIIGLSEVPLAGDKFFVPESEKEARKITDQRKEKIRLNALKKNGPVSLDDLFNQISEGELKELNIIVKADVQGSLEALKQSLEQLNENKDGVKVGVIHGGVGAVNETDVALAAASNAIIVAFNVRPDANATSLAHKEGVDVRSYRVIYNVIEEIEQAMKGLLDPEFKEVVASTIEVREVFKVPNIGAVAGCYVTEGTVNRKDKIRVVRDGVIILEGEIASLKRFKDDVKEVSQGYECGLGIDKFNDIKEGDVFETFRLEEIPRG